MSRLTQFIVVAFAASYWVLAEAGVEVEVLKKGEWMYSKLRGSCGCGVSRHGDEICCLLPALAFVLSALRRFICIRLVVSETSAMAVVVRRGILNTWTSC